MTAAAQGDRTSSSDEPRPVDLPYVIVADTSRDRTSACLDAIRPYKLGALVVRDGADAIRILERFGPPRLLVADLALPELDGFDIIDALRKTDGGRIPVIAWSPSRELREFAVSRFGQTDVRVLSASASPQVIRAAVARALDGVPAQATEAEGDADAADGAARTASELCERIRQFVDVNGVAAYVQPEGETKLRAAISWRSPDARPSVVDALPVVLDRVLETGRAESVPNGVLARALGSADPASTDGEALSDAGWLLAVPIITAHGGIGGALCVFDRAPVALTKSAVGTLEALGRGDAVAFPIEPPRALVSDDPLPSAAAHFRAVLLDRRAGELAIARELARVHRDRQPLSVVLLDVRAARAPDDSATGPQPDPVREVAEVLGQAIRGADLAILWNSESILVVLPGQSMADAHHVAERVRAVLQAGTKNAVSVSGSVVDLKGEEAFEHLVGRAVEKLRAAHQRGPNRIG